MPKSQERREIIMGLRLSDAERRSLYRQAGEQGQNPQSYLRDYINRNKEKP